MAPTGAAEDTRTALPKPLHSARGTGSAALGAGLQFAAADVERRSTRPVCRTDRNTQLPFVSAELMENRGNSSRPAPDY